LGYPGTGGNPIVPGGGHGEFPHIELKWLRLCMVSRSCRHPLLVGKNMMSVMASVRSIVSWVLDFAVWLMSCRVEGVPPYPKSGTVVRVKYEFEFPLPDKPWSTNEDRNLHPKERAARILLWKNSTIMMVRSQSRTRTYVQDFPLEYGLVKITIPFTTNRRRDPHNYCGTVLKAVIDGLVKAGVFKDDAQGQVGHLDPELVVGGPVRIVIT
jgi:Holliday junction resolvase RusA-like endonuclease